MKVSAIFLANLLLTLSSISNAQRCGEINLRTTPLIISPRHLALMPQRSQSNDESSFNSHDVELSIDFHGVAAELASEAQANCLQLVVVVNGFQRSFFRWPWPSDLVLSLRLGTHIIETHLVDRFEGGSSVGEWRKCSPTSRAVFDLVPGADVQVVGFGDSSASLDSSILLDHAMPCGAAGVPKPSPSPFPSPSPPTFDGDDDHHADHYHARPCREVFPPRTREQEGGAGVANANLVEAPPSPQPDFTREVRVVLVGSLHLAGQNLLALEQARRLRDLCVVTTIGAAVEEEDKGGGGVDTRWNSTARKTSVSRFHVTYLSTAAEGALLPLLDEANVPHHRYATVLDSDTITLLRASAPYVCARRRRRGVGDHEDAGGGDEEERDLVEALVEALGSAESMDALPSALAGVVSGLVKLLQGAHVMSFTNHETMVVNDRVGDFVCERARFMFLKDSF